MARGEAVGQGPEGLHECLLENLLHVGALSQDSTDRSRQTVSVIQEKVR